MAPRPYSTDPLGEYQRGGMQQGGPYGQGRTSSNSISSDTGVASFSGSEGVNDENHIEFDATEHTETAGSLALTSSRAAQFPPSGGLRAGQQVRAPKDTLHLPSMQVDASSDLPAHFQTLSAPNFPTHSSMNLQEPALQSHSALPTGLEHIPLQKQQVSQHQRLQPAQPPGQSMGPSHVPAEQSGPSNQPQGLEFSWPVSRLPSLEPQYAWRTDQQDPYRDEYQSETYAWTPHLMSQSADQPSQQQILPPPFPYSSRQIMHMQPPEYYNTWGTPQHRGQFRAPFYSRTPAASRGSKQHSPSNSHPPHSHPQHSSSISRPQSSHQHTHSARSHPPMPSQSGHDDESPNISPRTSNDSQDSQDSDKDVGFDQGASYGGASSSHHPRSRRMSAALTRLQHPDILRQYPSLCSIIISDSSQPGQSRPAEYEDVPGRMATDMWKEEGTVCLIVRLRGIAVTRRCDNNMINGTKLLNSARISRGRRDGMLKAERIRHVVRVGGMEYKGVWIPFERALDMAKQEAVLDMLYPLFLADIRQIFKITENRLRLLQVTRGAQLNPQFNLWFNSFIRLNPSENVMPGGPRARPSSSTPSRGRMEETEGADRRGEYYESSHMPMEQYSEYLKQAYKTRDVNTSRTKYGYHESG